MLRKFTANFGRPHGFALLLGGALAIISLLSGCGRPSRTSDPLLVPIQDMLDGQLPAGTPRPMVQNFLDMRGYPLQHAEQPGTIIAIIRHIDTQTVKPVTARVTFYFDANGRLNTFEMERAPSVAPRVEVETAPAAPGAPQTAPGDATPSGSSSAPAGDTQASPPSPSAQP